MLYIFKDRNDLENNKNFLKKNIFIKKIYKGTSCWINHIFKGWYF